MASRGLSVCLSILSFSQVVAATCKDIRLDKNGGRWEKVPVFDQHRGTCYAYAAAGAWAAQHKGKFVPDPFMMAINYASGKVEKRSLLEKLRTPYIPLLRNGDFFYEGGYSRMALSQSANRLTCLYPSVSMHAHQWDYLALDHINKNGTLLEPEPASCFPARKPLIHELKVNNARIAEGRITSDFFLSKCIFASPSRRATKSSVHQTPSYLEIQEKVQNFLTGAGNQEMFVWYPIYSRDNTPHEMSVIGSRSNKGVCEVLIRNSWGKDHCKFLEAGRRDECNDDGTFWISTQKLAQFSASFETVYFENIKTNSKETK